jgi:hypothetical protein
MTLVLLGSLLLSVLSAGPVLAKGPNRPQSGGGGACLVTPNPISNDVQGQFTVVGAGFQPYTQYAVFVGEGTILMTASDGSGNFSVWSWAQFLSNGTQAVYVYRAGDRHKTVLAACSFDVL